MNELHCTGPNFNQTSHMVKFCECHNATYWQQEMTCFYFNVLNSYLVDNAKVKFGHKSLVMMAYQYYEL